MQDTSFLNILHIAEFLEYRINSEYHVDKINSEKMPKKKKGTELSVKKEEKFGMTSETISGFCFSV